MLPKKTCEGEVITENWEPIKILAFSNLCRKASSCSSPLWCFCVASQLRFFVARCFLPLMVRTALEIYIQWVHSQFVHSQAPERDSRLVLAMSRYQRRHQSRAYEVLYPISVIENGLSRKKLSTTRLVLLVINATVVVAIWAKWLRREFTRIYVINVYYYTLKPASAGGGYVNNSGSQTP